MFGSAVTRVLIMALGYVYPAYDCFKMAERNRPDVEQLRFWCQYWMIIATVTVLERVADILVPWLPMYNEAKLAFVIYLWHPKTKGATYVYNTIFQPLVSKHEPEIDRLLNEFRTRAGDMTLHYWQLLCAYGHDCFMEVLRYTAAHAPSNVSYGQRQPLYQGVAPPQPRILIQEEVDEEHDETDDDYDVVNEPAEEMPAAEAEDTPHTDYLSRLRSRSFRGY